jgi:hypothetical protein
MVFPSQETLNLARVLISSQAGGDLPPNFARLYSQHTRLRERQRGLSSWHGGESQERLNDAVRLIEASFIEREGEVEEWRNGLRRAAELLEWLSHPEFKLDGLPTRLLAAAAYQLAGYPARSSGLLAPGTTYDGESEIIRTFLRAEFRTLFSHLSSFWARSTNNHQEAVTAQQMLDGDSFQQWIVNETASSFGILCAALRWGGESRLPKAIEKLNDLSKILLSGSNSYSWLCLSCAAR